MTTETTTTLDNRLRAWASGSLPCMAAVEFLLDVGNVGPDHPMICDDGYRAWPDVFDLEPHEWRERTGYMSGGERATWNLVRSILEGELNDTFWSLDATRKASLLRALGNHP